jgi:tetratricopeptide (TPR) repeat protein
LVTVVGEPGVGKTRLLAELASYVDGQPELVTWRQGRSLPYGEGITFWALGEIVKAQAGIHESDSPEAAADKLAESIAAVVLGEFDRAWLQTRLAPLVGATSLGGTAQKEESFTAWLRFLETIATKGPLVLVFEDLHWADSSLLEFIEHVVEWSTGVPILVICTARPELYEDHQGWGDGKRNSNTISLSALSDSETAQLISALLSQAALPGEVHSALLERAGGNPLYAEEFIRMLSDRGKLQRLGQTHALDPDADIPMPDSVQAIIAARLDTLSYERKALIHNAAVVGKVFWSGAVAALSDLDDTATRLALQELLRKELIRPARTSSMEGEQEYAFWHALVRDVAYEQIPRYKRMTTHQAVARWLEQASGERAGDHAEVLVHHYEQAFVLARASRENIAADELGKHLSHHLLSAAKRARQLDPSKAQQHYRRALELLPQGHPERSKVLVNAGHCSFLRGDYEEAEHLLETAVASSAAGGDDVRRAEAMILLGTLLWNRGATARSDALTSAAMTSLANYAPGAELATGCIRMASAALFAGRLSEAEEWARRALSLAEELKLAEQEVGARLTLGGVRCESGNPRGLEDLRQAVGDGLTSGLGETTSLAYNWLMDSVRQFENLREAKAVLDEQARFVEHRGLSFHMWHVRAESLSLLFDLGEWDQILQLAPRVIEWAQGRGDAYAEFHARLSSTHVLLARGRLLDAVDMCERLLPQARQAEHLLLPALTASALVARLQGEHQVATDLIAEFEEVTRHRPAWRTNELPTAVRILVASKQVDDAENLASGIEITATRDVNCMLTGQAIISEAKGDINQARNLYREAAQCWADYGFVLEEGQAHLGLARCLITLGDREAATRPLQKARAIFSKLGAVRLMDEADRHLGQATALTS